AAEGADHLVDDFVAAPRKGLTAAEPTALQPIDVHFSKEAVQVFNIGPSSCGVYGTTLGLAYALERFGTASLAALAQGAAHAAREGVEITPMGGLLLVILEPILTSRPEGRAIYPP